MSNYHGLLLDADRMATELGKRGQDWADKDAAFRALDEASKSILSQAMLAADDGPVTIKEAKARASVLYKDHLRDLDAARQAANKARVSYDVYRVYVDLVRTNAAGQRALVDIR